LPAGLEGSYIVWHNGAELRGDGAPTYECDCSGDCFLHKRD
jgi:hypothetical protein